MRIRAALAVLLTAVCCLAAPSRALEAQKKPKPQRDLVTRDELLESNQRDESLFATLRNLRPRMLEAPRGVRSLGNSQPIPTAVFIDGKPMGGLETLESIVSRSVFEVRYLDPARAGTEYGSIAGGGAVVVKLYDPAKHAPKPAKDSTPPSPR